MNKKELISAVAKSAECEQSLVSKVLSSYQRIILEDLQQTWKQDQAKAPGVTLLDIGKLKISVRGERTGINPRTKETMKFPSKNVPKFSASKKLKSFVENKDGVTVKSFDY